jgi:hypothetical protein
MNLAHWFMYTIPVRDFTKPDVGVNPRLYPVRKVGRTFLDGIRIDFHAARSRRGPAMSAGVPTPLLQYARASSY